MTELKARVLRELQHQKSHSYMCGGSQSFLDSSGHLPVSFTEEFPLPSNKTVTVLSPPNLVTFLFPLLPPGEGVQRSVQPFLLSSLPNTLPLMSVDRETEAHSSLVTRPGSASRMAVST